MKATAIIVKRVEPYSEPETNEIEKLAHSAGFEIADILTQKREEDREYNIGQGKVHESNIAVQENNADIIIVDNDLGPYQMYNYGIYVPDDVQVMDRYTLILQIFEQRTNTKKSQLQVEMARLRYELARAETKVSLAKREEHPGFMGLGEYDQGQEKAIKDRIKSIKEELSSIEEKNSHRREKRRDQGFDLVAIAGYTNSGKSTLLRRLSRDHTVDENDKKHNDLDPIAESTEKYFTTLDTTTRRMDFDRRDVLLTDTVGFIEDLPDWLIDAFAATFDSIYTADLVLLNVDVTESVEEMRKKIATCHNIMSRNESTRIITVFNKIDEVTQEEIYRKKGDLEALAPNPVTISAKEGTNINDLKQRIHKALPPFSEDTLLLPLEDQTMSLVSWLHDNANVYNCTYTAENVILEYEGRESVIEKAQSRAGELIKSSDN